MLINFCIIENFFLVFVQKRNLLFYIFIKINVCCDIALSIKIIHKVFNYS